MNVARDDWLPRHRITVDEYYRMAHTGVLAPEARVELIDGEVIDKAPVGSTHSGQVDRLAELFSRAAGDAAIVGVQRPIRLGDNSEPEPDLVLLRRRDDFYVGGHPVASDVLLVVEVAETSLRYDLHVKMALYARHAILEAWLVDLINRRVHFFRAPVEGAYTEVSESSAPRHVTPVALPGFSFDLSRLL